jgi:hypothetical protein
MCMVLRQIRFAHGGVRTRRLDNSSTHAL